MTPMPRVMKQAVALAFVHDLVFAVMICTPQRRALAHGADDRQVFPAANLFQDECAAEVKRSRRSCRSFTVRGRPSNDVAAWKKNRRTHRNPSKRKFFAGHSTTAEYAGFRAAGC